jgi:hypothetical protein
MVLLYCICTVWNSGKWIVSVNSTVEYLLVICVWSGVSYRHNKWFENRLVVQELM